VGCSWHLLIGLSLRQRGVYETRGDSDSPDALKAQRQARDLAKADEDICDTLEQLWRAAGKWPIEGIESSRRVVQLLGHDFQVNGYIPELDAFVILGVDKSEPSDLKAKEGRFPYLTADVKNKRILFQAHCSRPVIYLKSYVESASPIEAIRSLVNTCPKFTYKLEGDIAPQYITEAFYSAASYMENLGLDVLRPSWPCAYAKTMRIVTSSMPLRSTGTTSHECCST
jgi:hypothetical protein